jgi:hypothetical protein
VVITTIGAWFAGGPCGMLGHVENDDRASASWVSEIARRAGALPGTGDGTLRGEPVLVFAAGGWRKLDTDVYDRSGRRIATGERRRESPPVLPGRLGAWTEERAGSDRIDFSDASGAHAASVMSERAGGALVSAVTVTGPTGQSWGFTIEDSRGVVVGYVTASERGSACLADSARS